MRHEPCVESVTRQLYTHVDEIQSITAIIQYKDGTETIAYNSKSVADLCYEKTLFETLLHYLICGEHDL